jgi:hypothetical protein
MRFWVLGALLFVAAPAAADEMPVDHDIVEESVIVPDASAIRAKRTVVRRVVCIKCRSAGLPWGGLRPVRKAQLPWGGLPDYCPPAVSRTVVLVTKG